MSKTEESNKFGLGLLVGFLAGSTSYFLAKTDEGRELREKFAHKLDELKDEGLDFDEIKIGDLELSDLARFLLKGSLPKKKKKKKIIRKVEKRGARKKLEQPQKFKGV